ncbi:hypothetical protein HYPSUDRAFT_984419 [Hypholoma sublateritium FD-334 SS-4]|uniref:Uncharacterized protein n=1 Tax=Hypholoma sublateritium (strain FD-334 SS-4) TaxID=945553 RepID=A0A0D2PER3_HYPSF|nr:hypothetical protein HYPSUDRAFT_984419 [Hypholoma sublateritium FD-334 SS-4]
MRVGAFRPPSFVHTAHHLLSNATVCRPQQSSEVARIYTPTARRPGMQRVVLLSSRRSRKCKNSKLRTLRCIYKRGCQILSTCCFPSSFSILSFHRVLLPQICSCLP